MINLILLIKLNKFKMKILPNKEDFFKLIEQGYSAINISTEILADLETPVSCYLKLKNNKPSFLLESVEGGEKLGRYSTVGINPQAIIKIKDNKCNIEYFDSNIKNKIADELLLGKDPFEILEKFLKNFKAPYNEFAGLVGTLAYDTVRFIEPVKLKVDKEFPEAIFLLTGQSVIFDNLKRNMKITSTVYTNKTQKHDEIEKLYNEAIENIKNICKLLENDISKSEKKLPEISILKEQESISGWACNFTKQEFEEVIKRVQEHIKNGDIFQIVPSQQFKTSLNKKPNTFQIYRLLRSINPSPYLFYLDFNEFQLIGSSPEVMVKSITSEKKHTALLRPIAGTYRRGKSEEEDIELSKKLKQDPKELAEHLMLIDLARNDLGRIAVNGTVKLKEEMIIEKYSHVLHLVSEVVCDVKPNISSVEILKAVFPAGTLSGAPKVRAMQIISEVETVARGFYGGCTGYFGFDNSCNTAMTIRTVYIKDNTVRLQVGAGIVYDSVPSKEYQETINKGAALLKVIEQSLKD